MIGVNDPAHVRVCKQIGHVLHVGAGIDNSSLYRHFESKSALAQAVLDEALNELVEAANVQVAPTLEGLLEVVRSVGMALWDRPATARLILHLLLGWRDESADFRIGIELDGSGNAAASLFRRVGSAYGEAAQAGLVRSGALPEMFVPLIAVIVLRPATLDSLLVSQEPERSRHEQRQAWRSEIEHLSRAVLEP